MLAVEAIQGLPQRRQFVHFHNLDVPPETGALKRQVRINVQHPSVIVAHQPQAIVLHRVSHARRIQPLVDFVPRNRVVVQHPGNLEEGDVRAPEHIGNLRRGAGLAEGQPLARHLSAIGHGVEGRIVDGRPW